MMTGKDAPTSMTVTMKWRHVRFVLEALQELENKWRHINRTTADEDEQADYGNDLMALAGAKDFLEREAVKTFGPDIMNFSREPIAVTLPLKNGEHVQPR